MASILDGVTVGSLALMAVVTWQLGRAAVMDVVTAVLAIGSAVLLLRFRLNSTWLIVSRRGSRDGSRHHAGTVGPRLTPTAPRVWSQVVRRLPLWLVAVLLLASSERTVA